MLPSLMHLGLKFQVTILGARIMFLFLYTFEYLFSINTKLVTVTTELIFKSDKEIIYFNAQHEIYLTETEAHFKHLLAIRLCLNSPGNI
jgi:hypothetical protein